MAKRKTDLIAYCGIYCDDCPAYTQSIANLAGDLHKELKSNKLEKVAPALAKIPEFSAFKHYQKFDDLLVTMMKMICKKPCRAGGGSAECRIRKCAQKKNLVGCWQCDDFSMCKLLEDLGDFDKTYLKNLSKIRRQGPVAFVRSK